MVKFKDTTIDLVNRLLSAQVECYKSSLISHIKFNSSDEDILNLVKKFREAWDAYEDFYDVVDELDQED